jgi:hypothetical protein
MVICQCKHVLEADTHGYPGIESENKYMLMIRPTIATKLPLVGQ